MPELSSDPPFARGQTLGTDATQGQSVAGTVRRFLDVHPQTGVSGRDGTNISNRVVTCVAVRNASAAAITPGSLVKMKAASILTEVDGLGDNTAGQIQAVADEYLPAAGCPVGDIFWAVVRGPTTVKKTAPVINQGAAIGGSTTAGSAVAGSGLGFALVQGDLNATTVRACLTLTHAS